MRDIIHLSKPVDSTTAVVNFNVNDGLWVMMTSQCRFIDCDACTSLVRAVHNEGDRVCGEMVYGYSLFFLLNFAVNLKLLSKRKSIIIFNVILLNLLGRLVHKMIQVFSIQSILHHMHTVFYVLQS